MKWYKSESTIRPQEVDTTSSKTSVFLRRNIRETARVDEFGNEVTWFEYEEAVLSKEEYKEYLKGFSLIDLEQQRADIDYLAIMTGVEL